LCGFYDTGKSVPTVMLSQLHYTIAYTVHITYIDITTSYSIL